MICVRVYVISSRVSAYTFEREDLSSEIRSFLSIIGYFWENINNNDLIASIKMKFIMNEILRDI